MATFSESFVNTYSSGSLGRQACGSSQLQAGLLTADRGKVREGKPCPDMSSP